MLVSLSDMKAYLGISDGSQDAFLTEQLNIISEAAENYCNRKFESANYVETFYEKDFQTIQDSDRGFIYLSHYPMTALTSIERDGELVAATEYRSNFDLGYLRFEDGFFSGGRIMEVTYTAGYTTIPYTIQSAVKSLVEERYNKKVSGVALNFGSDVQRVSIPGTISIDFDYSLESNTRKSAYGTLLGSYINIFDNYRSEKRVVGSSMVRYVT